LHVKCQKHNKLVFKKRIVFLPHDAAQSAVMAQYAVGLSVRLSVRPSAAFRYHDHIGWNTSKKIDGRIL